jgi:hypothetical protein
LIIFVDLIKSEFNKNSGNDEKVEIPEKL